MDGFNNTFTVYQGSSRTLPMRLESSDCIPLDLTTATEIKAIFLSNDPAHPLVTKLLSAGAVSVVSAIGGKIAVNVAPADTALFQIQDAGDFEVEIDFPAGVVTVVEFKGALTVKGRLGSDC